MAIDKRRTSPAMKAGVIMLVVAFTLGIGGTFSYLFSSQPTAPGQTAPNGSSTQLDQLGTQNQAAIEALKVQLKAKPKDYDTLRALGDTYSTWAQGVKKAAPKAGLDYALWQQSADYYKRAIAVKAGDPNVETDMAISQFYSGDTATAIVTIEAVRKKNPKFAPAPFNAGIFYGALGDVAKATAALNDYLKFEPNGQNVAAAKDMLKQLQSGAVQPSTPATRP